MIRKTTALALTLALGLVACGDDTATNNAKDNKTMGTNTMMTGNMTNTMMSSTQATNTQATNTQATNTQVTATVVEDKGCDGSATEPARCKEDLATKTDWAPASVISEFQIATDTSCCQDYNGDGTNDNAVGLLPIGEANKAIAKGIADGSFAIVFEHEGLSAEEKMFTINVLQAEPETAGAAPNALGGTPYKVVPSSFAKGAYAKARIKNAVLGADGMVTAGPGNIALTISLFGIDLTLPLVQAQVRATADLQASDLASGGKGVALNDGELGGLVGIEALAKEINRISSSQCSVCYKKDKAAFSGDLFNFKRDGAGVVELSCEPGVEADKCDETDSIQNTCKTLAGVCSFTGAITGFADVKLDDIGAPCIVNEVSTCDALSIGTKFKAVGAKIVGVVAPK